MIKVSIVGKGNVSHHLAQAISRTEKVNVNEVIDSRSDYIDETSISEDKEEGLGKSKHIDIYILAVSDDAIAEISKKLKKTKSLVVHTSGSVPMNVLPAEIRRGVFYPLQTFSKKAEVEFKKVPICIEAENESDLTILRNFAEALSKEVYEVSSKSRLKLHLAAVFVNNFTNHLYKIGSDICRANGIPFSILIPLIEETAKKLENLSPEQAQTGPAKRGDISTMKKHIDLLQFKENKEIYTLISQAIQKTHGKKL